MSAHPLTATIWLVGSSRPGLAFTDPYDCNQYLIWDGQTGLLIDCGGGRGTDIWLANVAEIVDPGRLAGVLITHYHADHAGGAAAARAIGLDVFASAPSVSAIGRGDEQVTQLAAARRAGIYPPDFTVPPAPGLIGIPGGHLFGSLGIQVIEAPGHCDGHLVFASDQGDTLALFTGDTLFAGGRVSVQAIPDCRLDCYAETVQQLAELPIDALLPGHGEPDLDAASARAGIRSAASVFARLQVPPNLVDGSA